MNEELVEECCGDEEPVDSIPAIKPPCSHDSCSFVWSKLSETGGKLGGEVRLRGGQTIQLDAACEPGEECGALACFVDQDGKFLGIDINLIGNPETLEDIGCTDDDGNDLYVNPIRRIRQADGSCGLGGLPIPLFPNVCESQAGCPVAIGEGQEGGTTAGCSSMCVSLKNESCYPMLMTPTIAINSANLGQGPLRYRLIPEVNGDTQTPINVFSGSGSCCETEPAGSGKTSEDGGADTTSAGDPAHTHEGGAHDHDGPSHTHTMVGDNSSQDYSGTVTPEQVTIQPGETLEYCIRTDVEYTDDFSGSASFNAGDIRLCISGASIVTPETIATIEGN